MLLKRFPEPRPGHLIFHLRDVSSPLTSTGHLCLLPSHPPHPRPHWPYFYLLWACRRGELRDQPLCLQAWPPTFMLLVCDPWDLDTRLSQMARKGRICRLFFYARAPQLCFADGQQTERLSHFPRAIQCGDCWCWEVLIPSSSRVKALSLSTQDPLHGSHRHS